MTSFIVKDKSILNKDKKEVLFNNVNDNIITYPFTYVEEGQCKNCRVFTELEVY